ncbi:hypothetical protein HanPSC8_Chr10g0447231 [Helianthus annuus]|nr:hypothetical protein HanPSC8_Chr10g0447231 [Helianthus annuus]
MVKASIFVGEDYLRHISKHVNEIDGDPVNIHTYIYMYIGLGYIENPKNLRNPGNSKLPTFFFLKKITHVIYMFLRVLGQKNQKSAEGFFF